MTGEGQVQLKIPWIDRTKCSRKLDCKAAAYCKKQAFQVQPPSGEEPGRAADFPRVDLEECKQCGDCEKACTEGAVRMV